jgi:hypothetical protein
MAFVRECLLDDDCYHSLRCLKRSTRACLRDQDYLRELACIACVCRACYCTCVYCLTTTAYLTKITLGMANQKETGVRARVLI